MTDNLSDLLSQAIASLRLRDITLHSARFGRPSLPTEDKDLRVAVQTKRQVRFVRGETTEEGAVSQLLHVFVELGIRIVGDDAESPPVFFEIEADFLAEYSISSELSDDAVKVFAELNSVHNVWPFWRQHVFDIVQRARMPHIEVPLFAGEQRSRGELERQSD